MYEFDFKPFEEMTPEDYERVGFKAGLEVHQQLLTEKKLFCRCPAGKYSKHYDAEILRHMRPTLSEMGEYDGTALMEFKTRKNIIYRINRETVCTYEMDDTPPFMMNEQALDIAIEIGMLTDAKVVDEIHIARKQYLDGSIPTGFQRTAIVSVGGSIPYKDRQINLIQMSIEEDSCREVADVGHDRIYFADRLGMPLIETVTHPEMKTPQEIAEVNDILRRISRSTGKVRTGVGACREDVNVSVSGGTRIEIKGVPSIKEIPLLAYNESMRQWNLLKLREELKSRGIDEATFKFTTHDITKIVKKTKFQPIREAVKEGKIVKCVTLKGWKDLLRHQTQTDTYFAKEISDRVRVIACLTQMPNFINSDTNIDALTSTEGQKIRKFVGATNKDTLVIVWGDEQDAETGASEIVIRAKEATIGIPSETRQAMRDGTNGFERILPGPQRMYPDTDLPPLNVAPERREKIRSGLPDSFWERESGYYKLGLPPAIAKPLAISRFADLFEKIVNEFEIDPKLSGFALVEYPKKMKKIGFDPEKINPEDAEQIFKAYSDKKIVKAGIMYAMKKVAEAGEVTEDALKKPYSDDEIKDHIKKSLEKFENISLRKPKMKTKVLMGEVMDELRGGADGEKVEIFVEEILSEEK